MNPDFGIIYKITNTVNGKIYVGQTIRTVKERFRNHCNKVGCTYLHNAIKKYGKENFIIEVIEEAPIEKLDEREIFWIKTLKSTWKDGGYNIYEGGTSGRRNISKLTENQIKQLIQLDKEGVSHIQLGKLFNIDRKSVTSILKRSTCYKNKKVKLEDREDLQGIKSYLFANNPTMKEVCTSFKIGRNTLKRFADSIGYRFYTASERTKLGI